MNYKAVWKPLPGSQSLSLSCPCNEILYEGTRGPGKTAAQLARFRRLVGLGYGSFWRGVIFDTEYKNLTDIITQSKRMYRLFNDGARYLASASELRWVWPTGEELLFRFGKEESDYQNQIAAAYIGTYSDWKLESDRARGDLANVIADAIGRGVNPRETAQVISKRLDVSMSRAKNMAQTEQVGALRQAQWNETDWAADRLGLKTGLLWLSALKPTTRSWHASRHGKVYTTEQVRDFYAENGNRYNCYCSQIPVLLNDDDSIFNKGLVEKLVKERKAWKAG